MTVAAVRPSTVKVTGRGVVVCGSRAQPPATSVWPFQPTPSNEPAGATGAGVPPARVCSWARVPLKTLMSTAPDTPESDADEVYCQKVQVGHPPGTCGEETPYEAIHSG